MGEAIKARGQNAMALTVAGKCYVENQKVKGILTPAIDTKTYQEMYLFQGSNVSNFYNFYISKTQVQLTELWSDPYEPEKAELIIKCKNNRACILQRNAWEGKLENRHTKCQELYHENGHKKQRTCYGSKDGKIQRHFLYREDGTVKEKKEYNKDGQIGAQILYREDETQKEVNLYNTDDGQIVAQTLYRENETERKYTEYNTDGSIFRNTVFSNGWCLPL